MLGNYFINIDSDMSAYEQIAHNIGKQIRDGRLVYGEKLPSQRGLCSIFGVSRPTIIKALEILESENIIKIEDKKRAVVCSDPYNEDKNTVNWKQYTCAAYSHSLPCSYRAVSYLRSNPNVINLYECTFGKDFFPDKPLREVMKYVGEDMHKIIHHSSLDIRGTLSLRQVICDHLTQKDIYVKPSQVLICNNLQNAFKTIFDSICNPHINFFIENESIFLFDQSAPGTLNFQPIKMDREGMIPEEVEHYLRIRKKGILMLDTDYGMPTGITYSMKRRKKIIDISAAYNLPIIESNVVSDCWHTTPPLPTLKSMDLNNNIIYVFSLARPFMSMPMTAIVVAEQLMPSLLNVKLMNDEYTGVIPQIVMEKLLSKGIYTSYMDEIRPMIIERCAKVDELLKKYFTGIAQWEKPDRGVNCRLNFGHNMKHCFKKLLKDNILLYPPEIFGSDNNFIWFCYTGVSIEKLDFSLSKMAYYIKNNT